jgi:hypothetical protein
MKVCHRARNESLHQAYKRAACIMRSAYAQHEYQRDFA